MKLPYQDASSGKRAIDDIQKILRAFGCSAFATGTDFDTGEIFIQFKYRNKMINLKASAKGYASAWLKANPYSTRRRCSKVEHEAKALEIGGVAIYSVLRDWVKGQITAIEIGTFSFEAAFLSHIMLPNGKLVIEEITAQKMLPEIT